MRRTGGLAELRSRVRSSRIDALSHLIGRETALGCVSLDGGADCASI
jgi:hypothetical protein